MCIAYETVTSATGGLPLLAPMSEVAGRMAVQAGAYYLEKPHGGLGMLLGGVPGVDPAKVVILGGGVVGSHACHIALGMGAEVWVLDRSVDVLRALWRQFGRPLNTVFSTHDAVENHVTSADLVIGGVLIPGASAPKLVSAALVKKMKPGSVIVDVAIDQGGCFETSRPTTHADPVYVVDGVTHYCVANMPGGVPRTSTFALNNATLPFVLALAGQGLEEGARRRSAPAQRTQRRVRQGDVPARRRGARLRLRRAGRRSWADAAASGLGATTRAAAQSRNTAGSHNASCGNASSSSKPTICSTMNCIIPA